MNRENPKRHLWLTKLRKVFYWIIPIVILAIIFCRIDLAEFKHNLVRSNPWLVVLGIAYYPIVILIGALRWRTTVGYYLSRKLPLGFMLRHYWIGLALGLFAPASVGWDIYRVVASGRKFGRYGLNIAAVLFEKLMALLTMVVLVVLLYPFVRKLIVTNSDLIHQLLLSAYVVLAVSAVLLPGLALLKHHRAILIMNQKIERLLVGMMSRVKAIVGHGGKDVELKLSLSELVRPLISPRPFLSIFSLSLAIQVVSAVGNQIFFRAIGYEISLTINLFVLPIFYFAFILPISLGSLGIREGAYIVLYGIFGVPAEVALLVSFFNLSGILLNNVIGAVLIWHRSPQKHLPEVFAKSCSEK